MEPGDQNCYMVIHPLDDKPELKRQTSALVNMPPIVRGALIALQVYLILIALLVLRLFVSMWVRV